MLCDISLLCAHLSQFSLLICFLLLYLPMGFGSAPVPVLPVYSVVAAGCLPILSVSPTVLNEMVGL